MLSECELGVSQAEQPHVPVSECLQFSRTAANVIILAEHYPAALPGQSQPSCIFSLLCHSLAVYLGQCPDYQPSRLEFSWKGHLA